MTPLDLLTPQADFNHALADALDRQVGFAAGKISISHIQRLNYSRLVARQADPRLLKVVQGNLIFHSFNQLGLFPPDPNFYLHYDKFFMRHVQTLDYVGVFSELLDQTLPILAEYDVQRPLLNYRYLEPDRSMPDNPGLCYLPLLKGKRLLIVCPFADLLAQRAEQTTYEGVWARTGKHWFFPASVDALTFPYGFLPETQARYGTALALYEEIVEAIQRRDFDVALIGAAGLAIPIAAAVKDMGRVAIDMGGHLQVAFGVIGKRWRNRPDWQQYFNEWWIDMPDRYKPPRTDVCDFGAYW